MKAVLSVRDFAILYGLVNQEFSKYEQEIYRIKYCMWSEGLSQEEKEREIKQRLECIYTDIQYQDLCRIREKLGELHIEVETPKVEVE